MKCLTTAAILIEIGSFSALAQPRDAGEVVTRHATTTEGTAVRIRTYASWRSDCTPRSEPVVTIDPPPQHGTASVKQGLSIIQEYIGSASQCVGRQVPGTSVWYQPTPGFRGTDQFGLTINAVHLFHDQVVVEVR